MNDDSDSTRPAPEAETPVESSEGAPSSPDEATRLRSVLDGANLGTWEWNVQTGETRFNARWAEIIGYRLEQLEPVSIDTWLRFVHPDDLPLSNELLQRHFRGETPLYDCQCRMLHRDGGVVWVHDRGKVLEWSDDGRPLWMAGTHQDITDLKKMEEQRAALTEQLVEANRLESLGRLAGGVAHDFNNMLAVILGHAEVALDRLTRDDAAREDLEVIRHAAARSAGLANQLLAFSRKQPTDPRVVDLHQQIAPLLEMLRRVVGEGVRLEWIPGATETRTRIDPAQLDQLVTNLVLNARDAVGGAGTIWVQTRNESVASSAEEGGEGVIVIEVADDGHGVEPDLLPYLFDPFFTTKSLGKGTGLGLATVHGIVHQNGGHVSVESSAGAGTTFAVRLRETSVDVTPEPSAPATASLRGTAHVLVLEDEPLLLGLVARTLEARGFTVTTATSAEEAFEKVAALPSEPDLVVSDVVMPGLSGPALVARLRTRNPALRAVFMSAYVPDVSPASSEQVIEAPVLRKPFTREQLLQGVFAALGG